MEHSVLAQGRFRDFFASMKADGPEAFASAWLDYAHFDDLMQRCATASKHEEADEPEATCSQTLEDERAQFFTELTSFLETFLSQYETNKKHILMKKKSFKQHSGMRHAFAKAVRRLNPWMAERARRREEARLQNSELTQWAFWFRVYVETTTTAIRELLHQFDYHTGTKAGTDFLRDFQSSTGAHSDALTEKSTILLELHALESNLERNRRHSDSAERSFGKSSRRACPTKSHPTTLTACLAKIDNQVSPHDDAHGAHQGCHPPSLATRVPDEVLPSWSMKEEDLQCSICLDLLHNPISLGCGHCFCTDCVMMEARRVGAHPLTDEAGEGVRCPLCRRDHVLEDAITLDWLDRYIQTSHPKQWAKQRKEQHERAVASRRSALVQRLMAAASHLTVVEPIAVNRAVLHRPAVAA